VQVNLNGFESFSRNITSRNAFPHILEYHRSRSTINKHSTPS
jgi:hypothetical protein